MRAGSLRPALAALLAVILALATPLAASANQDWYIKGTVENNTDGAVEVGPAHVELDDASDVDIFNMSPIASGASGWFSFQADGFWEGADLYALYTLPEGDTYAIAAEDDVGQGEIDGNYAACSQSGSQAAEYVCSARWTGDEREPSPTYAFGPSASAPIVSAGQSCSGQMGGSEPRSIVCSTDQLGPVDAEQTMLLTFYNDASYETPLEIRAEPTGQGPSTSCEFEYRAQECTLEAGSTPEVIRIGPLDSSFSGWYGVRVVGEEDGPTVSRTVPGWPPAGAVTLAPTLSQLSVSPAAIRPTADGPGAVRAVAAPAGAGGGARISYLDSRPSTTTFVLARASAGVRRHGRCQAPAKAAGPGIPCTRWAPLPHRTVQSSLTRLGVRRDGRCRPAEGDPAGGRTCVWRRAIYGHFAHRDRAGRNALRFSARLDGRPLAPGRYRLTARARAQATALLSRPTSAHFRIVR